MSETRTIFDPFDIKAVEISNRLVDRLRGKYASGPHLPNGNPEFGWRQFEAPPIQHEAADVIEAKDAEIASLRAQLDEARAQVAMLSSPVAVHANMLRGTIAMPSLTNFLHAMGNHALVAIRETVAIAERNEKSKYVERARHLLNIDGGPPENLVDEARRKAIEECAAIADRWTSPEQRLHGHGGPATEMRALVSENQK